MDVSLCSQRLGTQPEFLTCSRGWAGCETARLGGWSGRFFRARVSQSPVRVRMGGSLLVGRSSDHLQPVPPASFVNAAACLNCLPAPSAPYVQGWLGSQSKLGLFFLSINTGEIFQEAGRLNG